MYGKTLRTDRRAKAERIASHKVFTLYSGPKVDRELPLPAHEGMECQQGTRAVSRDSACVRQ